MAGPRAAALLVERFGPGPKPVIARAPGRVNLIGEHTDYNDGYVLPFAIDRYTEVAVRPRSDRKLLAHAAAYGTTFSATLPLERAARKGDWSDYLIGILRELSAYRELEFGFEAAIAGDIPLGAGLSSSASLEVGLAVALTRLYGIEIAALELVKLCQRAESGFVGMPCGIMDQYAVYFAEANRALLLDTRSLTHRPVPLELGGTTFLVVDSRVRRRLAGSGYTDRRRECEAAVRWLAEAFPERGIRSLRDVDGTLVDSVRGEMPEALWKRAAHVVGENARVLAAVEALGRGHAEEVGKLLYASHASLRDMFEVSTPELDFLVDWGLSHGALGARLVGGGFGGVTLHLVLAEGKETYLAGLRRAYRAKFGLEAQAWEVRPAPGAARL